MLHTDSYKWTHGAPKGYGAWAFQIKIDGGSETYWHTGMYSDAKKAAIKHFGKDASITLLT